MAAFANGNARLNGGLAAQHIAGTYISDSPAIMQVPSALLVQARRR
jgi:hypothetical protein